MAKKKPRGPSGGISHRPGRGHDRESASERKKRFAEKQRKNRSAHDEDLIRRWEIWDNLTDEQRKLLPDFEPDEPRPPDGD